MDAGERAPSERRRSHVAGVLEADNEWIDQNASQCYYDAGTVARSRTERESCCGFTFLEAREVEPRSIK